MKIISLVGVALAATLFTGCGAAFNKFVGTPNTQEEMLSMNEDVAMAKAFSKYLNKENLNGIVAIDSCNTETNLFNSIVLSFKNSEEKLVFFDGEDGFIEIFKFEGDINSVDEVIKTNTSINSIEYHEIANLDDFIKYDIEDIINSIDNTEITR